MKLSNEAKEARRQYMREYRQKQDQEHVRAYQRRWRAENPEKTKQYNANFWEKQARIQKTN